MSERFVEAFVLSPSKLAALVGTPDVGYAAIHRLVGKKPIFSDMAMTLAGDDDEGRAVIEAGLDALAAGKKPKLSYPERLTQLVLHAHAERLKPEIMECNHMPSDDDGFWSPAFVALGMKTIAKQWARSNLKFPSKNAAKGWGWPVFTVVESAALATWKAELAKPWRKLLARLPNTTFDDEADDDDEDAFMSRDEVSAGIAVLEKWVTAACKTFSSKRKAVAASGNALLLILDGDQ